MSDGRQAVGHLMNAPLRRGRIRLPTQQAHEPRKRHPPCSAAQGCQRSWSRGAAAIERTVPPRENASPDREPAARMQPKLRSERTGPTRFQQTSGLPPENEAFARNQILRDVGPGIPQRRAQVPPRDQGWGQIPAIERSLHCRTGLSRPAANGNQMSIKAAGRSRSRSFRHGPRAPQREVSRCWATAGWAAHLLQIESASRDLHRYGRVGQAGAFAPAPSAPVSKPREPGANTSGLFPGQNDSAIGRCAAPERQVSPRNLKLLVVSTDFAIRARERRKLA